MGTEFIPKEIPRVVLQAQERVVDVPAVLNQERAVEVPQTMVCEVITQVPRPEEQLVEVQQVQTAEVVRQVPNPQVQTRQKPIPRIETQVVEKVVQVPAVLKQEMAVEVPQVMTF